MAGRSQRFLPSFGSAVLGAGLALHAVAMWRVHAVLTNPAPFAAAVLGAGTLAVLLSSQKGPARGPGLPAALALAALMALGAVAAPVACSRLGATGALMTLAVLVLLPAFVAARGPARCVTAGVAGAGLGALAGAFVLPFEGPLAGSLLGALLASAGFLLARPVANDPAAADAGRLGSVARLGAVLLGVAVALAAVVAPGGGSHPWPARPAQAGLFALAAALGLALSARVKPGTLRQALTFAGLVLAVLPALPGVLGKIDDLLAVIATSESHPAVGPVGGAITLLCGAALVGAVSGLGAGLAVPGAQRRAWLMATVLPFLIASALLSASASRALEVVSAPSPSEERIAVRDGHVVAWTSARRAPEDLLAAHLGALLAQGRSRAVVLGWGSPLTRQALKLHGFGSVTEYAPAKVDAPGLAERGWAPADEVLRAGSALRGLGPCDVVVSNFEDPTLPEHGPFASREAFEAVRRQLLPSGVFVQRLSLDALGPDALMRRVLLQQEVFPDTWLATADLGRGGSILAVSLGAGPPETERPPMASAPVPGAPAPPGEDPDIARTEPGMEAPKVGTPVEPQPPASQQRRLPSFDLLTSPQRLTPEVARSLRDARLLNADDLLSTFVAGPAEIELLRGGLGPDDEWTPGSWAFRHPAPGDVARELCQAMLYGRLAAVDIRFATSPQPAGGTHPGRWRFLGLDSSLGSDWALDEAVQRFANRLGRSFGKPAVSRSTAQRLVLTKPGHRLEIRSRRQGEATREVLAKAISDVEGDAVLRSGGAVVHGHPALWLFEQPSTSVQKVALAWYCPAQGRLYTATLNVTQGVKPGLYEEPLRVLADDLRCIHPEVPPQGGAAPAGTSAPAAAPSGSP